MQASRQESEIWKFEYYFLHKMEQKQPHRTPNRIELSEFGLTFLRQLPSELQDLSRDQTPDKQNTSINPNPLQRRGKGLDFSSFASQTQTLLHRQTSFLQPLRLPPPQSSQSQRKLQLHHDHWLSEQRLISHKLADTHARLQQTHSSEYDWRGVSAGLKQSSSNILGEWSEVHMTRAVRTRNKLKRLLARKYPGRG